MRWFRGRHVLCKIRARTAFVLNVNFVSASLRSLPPLSRRLALQQSRLPPLHPNTGKVKRDENRSGSWATPFNWSVARLCILNPFRSVVASLLTRSSRSQKAARVHIDSPIAQRPDHVKHKSSPDLSAGSNKIFR